MPPWRFKLLLMPKYAVCRQLARFWETQPKWTVSLRSSCKLWECIKPRYLERIACKVKAFFRNLSWTHRGLESSEEPQLCTDSSVGDFRAPRGVGCRLHGDRRLFCEENEPLSLSRNTSVLPTLLNPESDGRTRMGSPSLGTARLEKVPSPLAAAAGSSFTVAPMSAHWNSASWGPAALALLRTGRPSRDILVRNKSAACLLRESLLFRRCSLCSLPVHGVSELCGLHAAAAILEWNKPSADAQFCFYPAATHPDTPTLIWLAWSTGF